MQFIQSNQARRQKWVSIPHSLDCAIQRIPLLVLFRQNVFFTVLVLLIGVLLLPGCASVRRVDTDVTAFPRWTGTPPAPGTPYRFERLPSQDVYSESPETVERIAHTALEKVGLKNNPSAALLAVQITVRTQIIDRGINDGFYGGPGVFLGGGNQGGSIGLSFPLGRSSAGPHALREVAILMRDLSTQQVVYESKALQEDSGNTTAYILASMMDAALSGFPVPPNGTRRISTDTAR